MEEEDRGEAGCLGELESDVWRKMSERMYRGELYELSYKILMKRTKMEHLCDMSYKIEWFLERVAIFV